jgi:hypothetical protein
VRGLLVRWGVAGETRLRCSAEAGACTLETSGLLRSASHDIPLDALHGASVERQRSQNNSTIYRAILSTAEGSRDLSHYASSSRASHERLAREVNSFINAPHVRPLDVSHRTGWGWRLFAWMFVVIGLAVPLALRNVAEVVVDPSSRRLRIERRRFWQRAGIPRTIDLDEIEGLDIETGRGLGRFPSYRVVIRLSSGGKVPVFEFFASGRGSAMRRRDRLRTLLRDHVGLSH